VENVHATTMPQMQDKKKGVRTDQVLPNAGNQCQPQGSITTETPNGSDATHLSVPSPNGSMDVMPQPRRSVQCAVQVQVYHWGKGKDGRIMMGPRHSPERNTMVL
jgi:hypothetical protein